MAALFVSTVQEYRAQHKFLLHAYVVMNDHVHVLVSSESSIDKAMQLITGGFSYRAGTLFGVTGRIWNHRFNSREIRGAEEFEIARRYVHNNPVKAGMVTADEEYSSALPNVEIDEAPLWLRAAAGAAVREDYFQ
jgi:putative transposase